MEKILNATINRIVTICIIWCGVVAIINGTEMNECQWSIRNGKAQQASKNIRFLGQTIQLPVDVGMDDYIASVQKTLTDLDHQINEATAGWKFCSTNVVSIKCRNALRNAPSLSATAANTLQKLCKENERLLQNNATNDSRRARCLTCIGSILKRILFGLLPNYWIQFGLSFGVNERPTTTIPETETSYTPTGSDQSTIATGSTMPGQAVPGSTTPAKETGGGSTPAPTPALTTTATSAPDGSTATNDASGRSDNGAPGPS